MAVGTTTAILLGIGGIGAGAAASKMMAPKSGGMSSPLPMPQAPSPVDAVDKAANVIKAKRASASQSIYTSPLGVAGEASIARKTLLGQ